MISWRNGEYGATVDGMVEQKWVVLEVDSHEVGYVINHVMTAII